jgi:hypothetical protein
MEALFSILRAAHCRSTHHYFAIDSLHETKTENGKRLGKMLLANFAHYLRGAKDPDTTFKDFENHVVHVRDGFWGGAAKTAEKWLKQTHLHLTKEQWSQAAYSIGVVSHYFSDPWMPLHTGQTDKEAAYHRPLEWSICCAYQAIFDLAANDSRLESFQVPVGPTWLADAIHAGAKLSNGFYDSMMNDYDLPESHRNPALAIGSSSKQSLAQIFVWVLTGWGSAIDRIATECKTVIPEFSLALPAIMATVQIPAKKIVAKIASAEQRKEIEGILDEYLHTGKVVRNLTSEQKSVKTTKSKMPDLKPAPLDVERAVSLPDVKRQLSRLIESSVEPSPILKKKVATIPEPKAVPAKLVSTRVDNELAEEKLTASADSRVIHQQPTIDPLEVKELPTESRLTESSSDNSVPTDSVRRRVVLMLDSPIVDAPAIGPKTAKRLQAIGIHTVEELLAADPQSVANQLKTNWIQVKTVEQWQAQSVLACTIPGISAAGAGLLSLAGFESIEAMLSQTPSEIHVRLAQVAQSEEGVRILRGKDPPPLSTVQKWLSAAKQRC